MWRDGPVLEDTLNVSANSVGKFQVPGIVNLDVQHPAKLQELFF
jgi:hypothetical protein